MVSGQLIEEDSSRSLWLSQPAEVSPDHGLLRAELCPLSAVEGLVSHPVQREVCLA